MSLDGLLSAQRGLITRAQAVGAGLTPAEVDRRVRVRRWRPVHPRVYLAADRTPDDETPVRAAMLWAGQDAVLCGAAAAWWHGLLDSPPATVSITVPHRAGSRGPALRLRRRALAPPDVTTSRGLAVTALPLTLIEAAVECGEHGPELLDRGLRGPIRFPAVRDAHRRHPSPAAAALLADAAARSAPVAVGLLHRLLRGAGVACWRPTARGAAFPTFTVEALGWAWLPGAGLRFTWHDLVERPADVISATSRWAESAVNGEPELYAT